MKTKKTLTLVLAIVFMLSMFLPTYASEPSGEPVVIGSTFTLSGDVAHAGSIAFEGAQLAVKYVNEELGGILGRPVELKYYDDEFDETKIPLLYERLITSDEVDLLLSPYTSPFLAAAPVINKYDELMFCIAADSYQANEAFGQSIVNIQMDDEWKGGMWWHDVAEFFASFDEWNDDPSIEKPTTAAIVNLEIAYGHEVTDAIVPYWAEHGIEVIYNEYFDPSETDFTPIVSKLKELDPDILFTNHYFEGCVNLVEEMVKQDYYADYNIVEGMSWDPMAWPDPDIGVSPEIGKRGLFGYAVYKDKYQSETSDYLYDYVAEKYNSIPGNDIICGFMAVELAAKAANAAGSLEKADLIEALTTNTFSLAAYDYTMNESGGNAAEFSWGVGQYIPEDLDNVDKFGDDWYCVWPLQYADREPAYPFPGWP